MFVNYNFNYFYHRVSVDYRSAILDSNEKPPCLRTHMDLYNDKAYVGLALASWRTCACRFFSTPCCRTFIAQALREALALPCGQNARQMTMYARQRLCCASADGKGRTAKPGPAKGSLPCATPNTYGKAFAVRPDLDRKSVV